MADPFCHAATHPGLSAPALSHLQSWVGKVEVLDDVITAAPLRGQSALLDRDDALPVAGTILPPLSHWLYFLPQHRQSELGPDGHAKRGDLIFVLVRHAISNAQGLSLTEEHDIVYRAAAQPGDPVPPPIAVQTGAAWQREVVPDAVLLFRYSALTFNGHRIHYDRQYVTEVEGYPGLVVHGPLVATQLLDLVRYHLPDAFVIGFEFKLLRPTFDLHPYRLNAQPAADGTSVRVWAQNHEGWLTLQGTVKLACG